MSDRDDNAEILAKLILGGLLVLGAVSLLGYLIEGAFGCGSKPSSGGAGVILRGPTVSRGRSDEYDKSNKDNSDIESSEEMSENRCTCGGELYRCQGVFEIPPHLICYRCNKSERCDRSYFWGCNINEKTIKNIGLCTSCDIDDAGCDD